MAADSIHFVIYCIMTATNLPYFARKVCSINVSFSQVEVCYYYVSTLRSFLLITRKKFFDHIQLPIRLMVTSHSEKVTRTSPMSHNFVSQCKTISVPKWDIILTYLKCPKSRILRGACRLFFQCGVCQNWWAHISIKKRKFRKKF